MIRRRFFVRQMEHLLSTEANRANCFSKSSHNEGRTTKTEEEEKEEKIKNKKVTHRI